MYLFISSTKEPVQIIIIGTDLLSIGQASFSNAQTYSRTGNNGLVTSYNIDVDNSASLTRPRVPADLTETCWSPAKTEQFLIVLSFSRRLIDSRFAATVGQRPEI